MTIDAVMETALKISLYPLEKAGGLRESSIKDGGNWIQAFGARALFVAQIIASIVATPLILLGAILGAPFALCFGEKGDTWKLLKEATSLGILNLSVIPTCLIATFTPHSWEWFSPAREVLECLPD